jgi:hypothetical protein
MPEKSEVIEQIVEAELNMFLNVHPQYPVSCQQNPDGFRLHRRAQFSVWSEETLRSYHGDLLEAEQHGHNLLALKYARMDNLIPPLSANSKIDEIIRMQLEAQRGMLLQYPHILSRGRPLEDDGSEITSFETYLRGELETYSDRTLELLHKDLCRFKECGENWSIQIHTRLVRDLGYESLDEVEEGLSKAKR